LVSYYDNLGGEEFEEFTELPYGIRRRPTYYRCLRCGRVIRDDELSLLGEIMCPDCGYRILVKLRPPPDVGPRRRIYAI